MKTEKRVKIEARKLAGGTYNVRGDLFYSDRFQASLHSVSAMKWFFKLREIVAHYWQDFRRPTQH